MLLDENGWWGLKELVAFIGPQSKGVWVNSLRSLEESWAAIWSIHLHITWAYAGIKLGLLEVGASHLVHPREGGAGRSHWGLECWVLRCLELSHIVIFLFFNLIIYLIFFEKEIVYKLIVIIVFESRDGGFRLILLLVLILVEHLIFYVLLGCFKI